MFIRIGSYGVTGMVALDTVTKTIVISFRGAQSGRNLVGLFNLDLRSAEGICEGCKIHTGYSQSWLDVKSDIEMTIDTVNTVIEHAGARRYKIAVVGHSMGAALATVAAVDLRNKYPVVDLVSILLSLHGAAYHVPVITSFTGRIWFTKSWGCSLRCGCSTTE
jgi:pimeloyl-ACP methyl ester carboxylesterase